MIRKAIALVALVAPLVVFAQSAIPAIGRHKVGTAPPPTLVQSKFCALMANTSQPCTFTSPTSAGNLVYYGIAADSFSGSRVVSLTDNLAGSYTGIAEGVDQFDVVAYYQASNPGGITTITATLVSSIAATVVMQEWANVKTVTPLDAGSSTNFSGCGGSTVSLSAVTTTNATDVVIGTFAPSSAVTQPYTAGSGYTLTGTIDTVAGSAGTLGSEYANVSAASTYTPTVNGCDHGIQGVTAAFKAQ